MNVRNLVSRLIRGFLTKSSQWQSRGTVADAAQVGSIVKLVSAVEGVRAVQLELLLQPVHASASGQEQEVQPDDFDDVRNPEDASGIAGGARGSENTDQNRRLAEAVEARLKKSNGKVGALRVSAESGVVWIFAQMPTVQDEQTFFNTARGVQGARRLCHAFMLTGNCRSDSAAKI